MSTMQGLRIRLNDTVVGYLAHQSTGANIFVFADEYIAAGPTRPVLGQMFIDPNGDEGRTIEMLQEAYVNRQIVPPFFSNLLPEGVLREHAARELKLSEDNEFEILGAFGSKLPGAVVAEPVILDDIPDRLRSNHKGREFMPGEAPVPFSLGGSQLKFSMFRSNGMFTLDTGAAEAEYIVKPPHPLHAHVPVNEYVSMRLAAAAGLNVPEVLLLPLSAVDTSQIPHLGFPREEGYAYAIRRFDRTSDGRRIHIEDFAQVFGVYASEEYSATNYDTMMRAIYALPHGKDDLMEFVGRLLVNALLANGDAHLKNHSLIYSDGMTPRLAPLYDVVSTQPYIRPDMNESAALNLGKTKDFADYDADRFDYAARRGGIDRALVRSAVAQTLDRAMSTWPTLFRELEVPTFMWARLQSHWRRLRPTLAAVGNVIGNAKQRTES